MKSIRTADLRNLFPNLSTAESALELLRATGCSLDDRGGLVWVNPVAAAQILNIDQVPQTLSALDGLTGGGASLALSTNHPVDLLRPSDVEISANAMRGILVLRRINQDQPIVALPSPANDPGTMMLVSALADKRMCLFRQPIVSSQDASIVRWECLSRLIQDDGRVAQPYEFIPAAERAGLVGALDLETLSLALKALGREPQVKLAVNVSAATIADQGSRSAYNDMLAGHANLATRLTVEITETIAIHDLDIAARFGHAAKAAGARLALDDFGEGHTSFQSLRTLPLDEVKIDGLYVEGIDARAENHAFVVAIDRLARDLGMETVAERVETLGEASALRQIGVDNLQGYYYGKPRSAG